MNTHSWSQPYIPQGKYNRLFEAQKILQSAEYLKQLDRLEPITDLTQANNYLDTLRLSK